MTAKRKAYELFCLFEEQQEYFDLNQRSRISKQCALIAVDEIISACEYNRVESWNTDWWNEVKSEIEKL